MNQQPEHTSTTENSIVVWGEKTESTGTLEKVNVRRLMNYIQRNMTEYLEADLFVASILDELKILQRKTIQEKIEEYREYMDLLLRNLKVSGAINEYAMETKGMVKAWEHKKDGTMFYTWHDGTTQEMVGTKHKPRRRVRVLAKRAVKTMLGFDTKMVLHKPVESIKINMVLTKDGAEFK